MPRRRSLDRAGGREDSSLTSDLNRHSFDNGCILFLGSWNGGRFSLLDSRTWHLRICGMVRRQGRPMVCLVLHFSVPAHALGDADQFRLVERQLAHIWDRLRIVVGSRLVGAALKALLADLGVRNTHHHDHDPSRELRSRIGARPSLFLSGNDDVVAETADRGSRDPYGSTACRTETAQ